MDRVRTNNQLGALTTIVKNETQNDRASKGVCSGIHGEVRCEVAMNGHWHIMLHGQGGRYDEGGGIHACADVLHLLYCILYVPTYRSSHQNKLS